MKVVIRGELQNLNVTTLILEAGEDVSMLKVFHCQDCSKPVFQYIGEITSSIPGFINTPIPTIHQCHSCKKRYLIHRVVYPSPEVAKMYSVNAVVSI